MPRNTTKIIILFLAVLVSSPANAVTTANNGSSQISMHVDNISWDNIGNMVTSTFIPESNYTFEFVHGSKNIDDGSDFAAVRKAFGTWIDLPDSAITATETPSHNQLDFGSINGRDEISWITAENIGSVMDFPSNAIAFVITWYYVNSRQVVERDMYFNDINMDWYTDSSGDSSDTGSLFYVEQIALHEIGHIYGLKDLYNPGQSGYEKWMGHHNEDISMYGYSYPMNEDITLTDIDAYAMALAHPAPEPSAVVLFGMVGGIFLIRRNRPI